MACRILACFALLVFSIRADDPHWSFLLQNTVLEEQTITGLRFYFVSSGVETVAVAAVVEENGQQRTCRDIVNTEVTRGDTLLACPMSSLDTFHVVRLTLDFGRYAITLHHPQAGEIYHYSASRGTS